MSMRVLQWFLIVGCIAGIVLAITGVQSFSYDSASGSQVSYYTTVWQRIWGIATAVVCGLGAWGIYRRAAIVWRLGWVALIVNAILFVVAAAIMLLPQQYGWVGVIGVAVGAILVVAYWGTWWHRHREYFSPEGTPPGWRPDLSPLRWFGIGMFVLGLILVVAVLLGDALHK
jgi:uncharacterized membrane protein YfcA